jgi:ketosteroid isomerase-like protein
MRRVMNGLVWLLVGFAVVGGIPYSQAAAGQAQGRGGAIGAELTALLTAQQAAWNRGDIDGFMSGYWRSEETTFSGTSGVTRGWQAVVERYHRNYPDRATMGHLDFSEIEVTPLGNDAALILGKWHLDRASGLIGGVFTLVARRFPEGWRIIHDHTSAVDAPTRP